MATQRILFISGSSRVNGTNWRLAASVADLARRTLNDRIDIITMDIERLDLPAFHPATAAQEGLPEDVTAARKEIAQSASLFVSSDEYTGMYSAIFRNFAFWVSADIQEGKNLLDGKRIVLCGASMGGVGGIRGQPALHQFLVEFGADVVSKKLDLGSSMSVFDEHGDILPKFRQQIMDFAVYPLIVPVG